MCLHINDKSVRLLLHFESYQFHTGASRELRAHLDQRAQENCYYFSN